MRKIHAMFSDGAAGMSAAGIKAWIRAVNGRHSAEVVKARAAAAVDKTAAAAAKTAAAAVGGAADLVVEPDELQAMFESWVADGHRGSPEFRQALSLLQATPGGLASGELSADGLVEVYGVLIRDGKFWYVEHDVNKLGVWQQSPRDSVAVTRPFEASFDYIWFEASRLQLCSVRQPLTAEQSAHVYHDGETFPCAWHMSDHLPVAASFEFRGDGSSKNFVDG